MERRKRLPSQLAKAMGVSHPTVIRWLSGEDVPSTASCRKLAAYSDVPLVEILSMSGKWISTKDLLTQKMTDLKKVGESSLTIEPVEELTPD